MPLDSANSDGAKDEVLAVLYAARGRVARLNGWCQRSIEDNDGRVCVVGALARRWHSGVLVAREPMYRPAVEYLALALGLDPSRADSGDVLVCWNDAPERTQADVVALYDRAIELREADLVAEVAPWPLTRAVATAMFLLALVAGLGGCDLLQPTCGARVPPPCHQPW